MNLQFHLKKLKSSQQYKKFIRENPDAFLCSGFFSIDKVGTDNKQHFDFFEGTKKSKTNIQIDKKAINEKKKQFSDNTNEASAIVSDEQFHEIASQQRRGRLGAEVERLGKIFSFQLEDNFRIVPLKNLSGQVPDKLDENTDFSFEEIENIIYAKIKEENIKNKIQKILFSLQKLNGKNFLIGTVFISGFGLLKINIDLKNKKITNFEKKSFFDMVNIFRRKDK